MFIRAIVHTCDIARVMYIILCDVGLIYMQANAFYNLPRSFGAPLVYH